jgi:hypothetical protein
MDRKQLSTLLGSGLVLVILAGCNLPGNTSQQPTQASTPIISSLAVATGGQVSNQNPTPTVVEPPTSTLTDTQSLPTATATESPACTVLQVLNFRSGPGTAYRPPISTLPEGTKLIPQGYNPVGVPGGSWVEVKQESGDQIGWVSSGNQFISCNIELTLLPSIEVPPPPPPPLPDLNSSKVDGDNMDQFVGQVILNPDYLVRMKVYRNLPEFSKDGDGIKKVDFSIFDNNSSFSLTTTELNKAYCFFGGGDPNCNTWVLEDYMYKWSKGGQVLKSGSYRLVVQVTATDGTIGTWFIDKLEITVP